MKRVIVISLLLAAALVPGVTGISCSTSTAPHEINYSATPPEVGEQAPDFTVTDLSGKAVKSSDFVGNPVLLNFWSIDCVQCTMERDILEEIYKEYPDIKIMMVDSKDDIGAVKRYVRNIDFTLPVYMDEEMTAAAAYDVHLIPETFLIDKDGIIEYIQNGAFTDRAQLENALTSITK